MAVLVVFFNSWGNVVTEAPSPAVQNHDLGIEIMKRSMMIFETAGVSILTAMIAATATALPFKKNQM